MLHVPDFLSSKCPWYASYAFTRAAADDDRVLRRDGIVGSFSWLGPRCCRCVQAWFEIMGYEFMGGGVVVACVVARDSREVKDLAAAGELGDLSQWRLVSHTRWSTLVPVPPGHEAAAHISRLRPAAACTQRCSLGWCTDVAAQGRGAHHAASTPPDSAPPAAAPCRSCTCGCYPEIAHADPKSGDCVRHPVTTLPFDCPDECSGIGKCKRGFCSCPPGFWGLDCGLSIDASGAPFVWKARHFAAAIDTSLPDQPAMYVYDTPVAVRGFLYQTRPFINAALVSPFRTADPDAAAVFWLPISQVFSPQVAIQAFRWARRAHPYFNRSVAAGFANHVIVQPADSGFWTSYWGLGVQVPELSDPALHQDSPDRVIISIQLNGRIDAPPRCKPTRGRVYQMAAFQPGKDIMVPPWSHSEDGLANRLPVRTVRAYSPHSETWRERHPGRTTHNRPNVMFFSGAIPFNSYPEHLGSPKDVSGRGTLYLTHRNRTGWVVRNHWTDDERVALNRGATSSTFCFVPYGQSGGYGGRYVHAAVFGCIPVFFEHTQECARAWPLAELPGASLEECSVKTNASGILTLHERLAAVSPDEVRRKQECLGRVWPRMAYSSWHGPFLGESGKEDAWNGVTQILRLRWLNLTQQRPEAARIILPEHRWRRPPLSPGWEAEGSGAGPPPQRSNRERVTAAAAARRRPHTHARLATRLRDMHTRRQGQ